MYDIDTETKHTELINLLEDVLGDHRGHHSSTCQINFDCPTCSAMKGIEYDGKGNLEVNYGQGVYKCWACAETDNTKGFLFNLFKEFGNKQQLAKFIAGGYVFDSEYYSNLKKDTPKEVLKLPDEYFSLTGKQKYPQFAAAFNYLYGRRVTDEIIEKFKIGFCLSGKYENRVIVPSYDKNGVLNYFISRSISKYVKKFKYLNPKIDKKEIVFNENLINWDKTVFLVEGVFDHIVIPNSIPLLGKNLYNKIFELIYFKSNAYIVILLDSDAHDDSVKIYNKLNAGRLRNRVLINTMPEGHDVSSFNQVFGEVELKNWLKNKNYRLND